MVLIISSPHKGWTNDFLGGKSENGELLFLTAWREACEESGKELNGFLAEIAILGRGEDKYGVYVFFADDFEGIKSSPEGFVRKVPLNALIEGMIPLGNDSRTALELFLQRIGESHIVMNQPGGENRLVQLLTCPNRPKGGFLLKITRKACYSRILRVLPPRNRGRLDPGERISNFKIHNSHHKLPALSVLTNGE